MNRRKFIQVVGLGFVATLASNILAACGGSSSSGGDSGTTTESDWTSFPVSGSGKTYTVEIDFYHFHNAGESPHEHRVDLSVDNLDKINNTNNGGNNAALAGFQAVTVVCTSVAGHDHNVRITRTA